MKHEAIPFEIRLATNDDLGFVIASWLGMRHRTHPNMFALDFAEHEKPRIRARLDSSITIVAQLEGHYNELLGCLVYGSFIGTLVMHFATVKDDAREQGIFTAMLMFAQGYKPSPVVFTTPARSEDAMKRLCKRFIYDPSILETMEAARAAPY